MFSLPMLLGVKVNPLAFSILVTVAKLSLMTLAGEDKGVDDGDDDDEVDKSEEAEEEE